MPFTIHEMGPLVIILGLCSFAAWIALRHRNGMQIPGPRPLPVIGNLFDFKPTAPWETFTSWRLRYGHLLGLRVLGNNILVLNDLKTINDFLDKRGSNYSHRPVFTVAGELMELEKGMGFMPYGSEWRASRKMANLALSPSAARKYHNIQEEIAAMLAVDISNEEDQFFELVRMAAGRLILSITYGISVTTPNSKYIAHAEETMKLITESTIPGAYLCDLIPILKYLPSWIPFQRQAARGKRMIAQFVSDPFEAVKKDVESGTALPSLTEDLLNRLDDGLDRSHYEGLVMWTTGSMYGAGGETTYSTVLNFIMVMALHPQIQQRAFEELAGVVGRERLPAVTDRDKLPYLSAVIKETMRWSPVLPLSIARRSASDDVYNGYVIPQGTIVIPNSWAIAFEPNPKYPPKEFIPERFLDDTCPCTDPAEWAFGFGRRICPGKFLAEHSVFILVATLLYTFRITEREGCPLIPQFASHLVRYPLPFKCCFYSRLEGGMELLRKQAA